ncbi:hypothetical protein [Halosegnis longus]|uniref:Uncharacterized protein n=1 Tax=Halosegnis longus TaxID=2216012 RepID=A0AAJ4R6R8_9EURY|nr:MULTISPECIES: hypothetical protein [Halobacteriales]RNJ25332.1 hypothetical protein Nmn1133_00510 [Salella cibi]
MDDLLDDIDEDATAALETAENPETRYHLREIRQRLVQVREQQAQAGAETPQSASPQSPD